MIKSPERKSCHFHVVPGANDEFLVVLIKVNDTAIKSASVKNILIKGPLK